MTNGTSIMFRDLHWYEYNVFVFLRLKQNDALWVGETLLSAKYVGMGSEREVLFL